MVQHFKCQAKQYLPSHSSEYVMRILQKLGNSGSTLNKCVKWTAVLDNKASESMIYLIKTGNYEQKWGQLNSPKSGIIW